MRLPGSRLSRGTGPAARFLNQAGIRAVLGSPCLSGLVGQIVLAPMASIFHPPCFGMQKGLASSAHVKSKSQRVASLQPRHARRQRCAACSHGLSSGADKPCRTGDF
jgi:hypothetical protein